MRRAHCAVLLEPRDSCSMPLAKADHQIDRVARTGEAEMVANLSGAAYYIMAIFPNILLKEILE